MSEFAASLTDALGTTERPSDDEQSERRAAIYARTSSTSQRFGYSIDEQIRQCAERCQMLNWTIAFVYRDEATSGKDTDRPMFQQMLSQAERGVIDVVVFWKLDRFSRSIMHAVQLEKQFRNWGVALHSVTEQLDTTTPAGQFNFRNLANAAEFEREMIRQRTKMGHAARATEGKWPNGTPPLGYECIADGRLRIDESEAVVVRQIFGRYLETQSMPVVAEELNEQHDSDGVTEAWTPTAVGQVLRNRLYVGEYSVGEIERNEPAYQIVSREIFDEATAVRTRFQSSKSHKRGQMSKERKREYVERIVRQYREWLR